MLTFALSIAAAVLAYLIGPGDWKITCAVIAFLIALILIFRHFGKKLQAVVQSAQEHVMAGRAEVEKLIHRAQNKQMTSPKAFEEKAEKLIADSVREAIQTLDAAQPLFKWVVMGQRQVNTVKMQWLYQIKEFDQADPLMNKAFEMDPMIVAMKMARAYMRDPDADLEHMFRKGTKKFKRNKGAILYAVYSWILIKRKQNDRALEVLVQAKEQTDNEVLHRNWDLVVNNKIHLFSNAALGDVWYSLHLEKPPRQKAGKGQLKGHPMYGRGKRKFQ